MVLNPSEDVIGKEEEVGLARLGVSLLFIGLETAVDVCFEQISVWLLDMEQLGIFVKKILN